jgi:hypothetical protein
MDGQCCLLQVPFKLEAGPLNELFIFLIVRHFRNVGGDIGTAHPFQVDVQESVRSGQQARRLRRRVLPQLHNQCYGGHKDQKTKQYWKKALDPHGKMRPIVSNYKDPLELTPVWSSGSVSGLPTIRSVVENGGLSEVFVLRSTEFLGESDEEPFRPADVAEPIRVFILDYFAYELGAALAEPFKRLVDVVHGEHDAKVT